MRELYERRKQQGLCIECGKPARDGKTRCAECAKKGAGAEAVYKQKLKQEHKCMRCATPLPDGWVKVLCQSCTDKVTAKRNELVAGRRARGECPKCGVLLPDKSHKMCPECREISLWYYRRSVIRAWRG